MSTLPRHLIGSTDVAVSELVLGSGPLGGLHQPVSKFEAVATVETAIDLGIVSFDTAPYYGHGLAEQRVGFALEGRSDIAPTVSTKVGRLLEPDPDRLAPSGPYAQPAPFSIRYDYTYDGVMRSFEASTQRMLIPRVDIALVHDIDVRTHGADYAAQLKEVGTGALRALAELKRDGRVGAIGIGVNEVQPVMDVLDRADIDVVLLAGRYSLIEQHPLDELFPRCRARGVSILVGGVLASGILAGRPVAGSTYDYLAAPADIVDRVNHLADVAEQFDVPLGAMAIQFVLAEECVAAVCLGPRDVQQLKELVAWYHTPIPPAVWHALTEANLLDPRAHTPIKQTA